MTFYQLSAIISSESHFKHTAILVNIRLSSIQQFPCRRGQAIIMLWDKNPLSIPNHLLNLTQTQNCQFVHITFSSSIFLICQEKKLKLQMFFLKIKLQFHKSSTRKLFMKLPLHPSLLYLSEAL